MVAAQSTHRREGGQIPQPVSCVPMSLRGVFHAGGGLTSRRGEHRRAGLVVGPRSPARAAGPSRGNELAFAAVANEMPVAMFVFVILGHFTAVTAFDAQGVDVDRLPEKGWRSLEAARRLAMPRGRIGRRSRAYDVEQIAGALTAGRGA